MGEDPLELVGPAQVQLGEVHQVDDRRLGERDRARVELLGGHHVRQAELVEPQLEVGVAEPRVAPAAQALVLAGGQLDLGARQVEQRRLDPAEPRQGHRPHRQAVGRPPRTVRLAGQGDRAVAGDVRRRVVALDVPGDRDGVPERRLLRGARTGRRSEGALGQREGRLDVAVLRQAHHAGRVLHEGHGPIFAQPGRLEADVGEKGAVRSGVDDDRDDQRACGGTCARPTGRCRGRASARAGGRRRCPRRRRARASSRSPGPRRRRCAASCTKPRTRKSGRVGQLAGVGVDDGEHRDHALLGERAAVLEVRLGGAADLVCRRRTRCRRGPCR